MPNKWELPESVQDSLIDPFAGDVRPKRSSPALPTTDGRTAALSALFDYFAALRYFRAGDKGGPPIKFAIPRENFLADWPDGAEVTLFPSVVALESARGERLPNGLTYAIQEDTFGLYAPNTAILRTDEWREEVQIEVWSNYRAERRAIMMGIESAMTPVEGVAALRLKLRDYYDSRASFRLLESMLSGDVDNARGRRRAILTVEMRFVLGVLVNVQTMQPITVLGVDVDPDTGLAT